MVGSKLFAGLLFVVFFVSIKAAENNTSEFICYHGDGFLESYNLTTMTPMKCPSQKCVIFYTYCENYWATTCYRENYRNAIFKEFEFASQFSETRAWRLDYCNRTGCNKWHVGYPYSNYISYIPETYDQALNMNLKVYKLDKVLQNSAEVKLGANEELNFTGTIDKPNTSAWIQIAHYLSSELQPFYYEVTTKSNSSKANETVKPGDEVKITLQNSPPLTYLDIRVNNKRVWAMGADNNTILITYGGGWATKEAYVYSRYHQNLTSVEFKPMFTKHIIPKFYPFDLQGSAATKSISVVETRDYEIQDGDKTTIKIDLLNPLTPNGRIDFEFRENLSPESDLIKIDVRSVVLGMSRNFQYISTVYRRKSWQWSRVDDMYAKYDQGCDNTSVSISSDDRVQLYCGNRTVFSLKTEAGSFNIAKYGVQSTRRKFACF